MGQEKGSHPALQKGMDTILPREHTGHGGNQTPASPKSGSPVALPKPEYNTYTHVQRFKNSEFGSRSMLQLNVTETTGTEAPFLSALGLH